MPQPTTSQYMQCYAQYISALFITIDFEILSAVKGPCLLLRLCRYYGNGQTGKESEFYDVGLLDSFIHTATLFQTASDILQPNADLWLGETSSLYDSGAPHLSDSYVAGFM